MDEGEVPVFLAVTSNYKGHMLFFFQNGKCAKVPLASYETKQNRKKLLKAYSDKAELCCMMQLAEETELAIFTTSGRLLLAGSALIAEKATRDTAGVNVITLKKNATIAAVRPAQELELADAHRYRVRSLPGAGALLKENDTVEQMHF
jgi:DNA gyrase subunit A